MSFEEDFAYSVCCLTSDGGFWNALNPEYHDLYRDMSILVDSDYNPQCYKSGILFSFFRRLYIKELIKSIRYWTMIRKNGFTLYRYHVILKTLGITRTSVMASVIKSKLKAEVGLSKADIKEILEVL